MPDGFDPHTELARIFTLRDLMRACRERMPEIMQVIDDCLRDEDPTIRLEAAKMAMDRGFGKPRQHVEISVEERQQERRVLILPDNGRKSMPIGPVIDVAA